MTTLRDTDFVVWNGEIIPGDDARDAASEARHGGRLITHKLFGQLTAGVEGTTERGAAMAREAIAGELGDVTLHRTWHYSIDPAGGFSQSCMVVSTAAQGGLRYATGSKVAWASVAKALAKAGGNRDLPYLRTRRGVVPREAFDWPIYRIAAQARERATLIVAGAI